MIALILILLPLVVGTLLFLLPREEKTISKVVGTLVAGAIVVIAFVSHGEEWTYRWLAHPFVANFHFGATYLSHWLVVLLSLCTFGAVLATNVPRARSMIAALLLLEGTMAGLFLARDLLVFALFWDAMLLPVFFVLLSWGPHPSVAWRYFIYNFAGGLVLLLAVAAFGAIFGTTDVIGNPAYHGIVSVWAPWILAGFVLAFLVKTPVWPLHTWMPATYEATPAPMVAVVSGVQSKAGLYGLLAIAFAIFPTYLSAEVPVLIVLAIVSLLYGAFVALVQADVKLVVAYSSLSHLGLVLLAIVSLDATALQGALLYIVAHGLFSAALFLILGYVEEREGTRALGRLGGLGWTNPRITGAFCIAALALLGLPGLAGFAGELIILIGVFAAGYGWAAILALVAIVTASAYTLRLLQGATQGAEKPELPVRADLTWREGLAVAPLLAALLYFGVYPHALLAAGWLHP
ncbi:MAG: complex I subunit 4 family protein [Candidatus Tyrphobacter sp.]